MFFISSDRKLLKKASRNIIFELNKFEFSFYKRQQIFLMIVAKNRITRFKTTENPGTAIY